MSIVDEQKQKIERALELVREVLDSGQWGNKHLENARSSLRLGYEKMERGYKEADERRGLK